MSVTNVKFMDDGHTGNFTGSEINGVSQKYTATLKVTCDSKADTPDTVRQYLISNASFPSNGRYYKVGNSFNTNVYCNTLDVRRIAKSETEYLVTANYEPSTIELQVQKQDGQGKPSNNPFTWRDEISVSNYTVTIPAYSGTFRGAVDVDGFPVDGNKLPFNGLTPVMNSGTTIFDPPPGREVSVTVVRITKYVSSMFPHLYQRYIGSVNNDNVVINKGFYGFLYRFAPYQGKIKDLNGVFDIANGIPHFKQTLELHINPLGWRWFIPDKGSEEIFGAQEQMDGVTISNSDVGSRGFIKRRVLDPRGNLVEGLLDGNGHLLRAGQSPVFLIYQLDNELSFAGINW